MVAHKYKSLKIKKGKSNDSLFHDWYFSYFFLLFTEVDGNLSPTVLFIQGFTMTNSHSHQILVDPCGVVRRIIYVR